MSVSLNLILDTRRIKKSSKYPVKLRATFERIANDYQTIFDLSKEDFEKLSASRINADLQSIKEKLKEIERTGQNAAAKLDPFTFEDFNKYFIRSNNLFHQRKQKNQMSSDISDTFDYSNFHKRFSILTDEFKAGTVSAVYFGYIKNLLQQGRIGTAVNYHDSYVALKKFRGHVRFSDVTASFLFEYESSLKARNLSKTTIGMYIRPIRTMFNEAIEDGIISREKNYPFGKRKYRIPTSKNVKKALDLEDVKKIYYYQCDPTNENEQRGRDFWLFSYFGNGMNVKDIAGLQYKNIHDQYLVFERAKTERSLRDDPKPITVFITDDMWVIIDRWGNGDRSPNNFIFPILEPGLSPLRQFELNLLFVAFINNWMKKIMVNLGIEKKATTYVARHTFSTVLKRSGASTEYIQEALGHTDVKTTQHYLDSFDREVKKEFAQQLTSFKNENCEPLI